jgi:hypothetical protein
VKQDVVLQHRGPSLAALLRWSGLALVAGGLLMVVATALHPSRETPATILEAEVRLVAAHALFTLSSLLVLLGLPGLYGAASAKMGRLGVIGFITAFTGTMLIAVSGNFGFLAPALATESPQTIDAINRYLPEVVLNGVAFGGFVVGFVMFDLAWPRLPASPAPRVCSSPLVPRPAGWIRSGRVRLTGVVGRCRPWERGPWRRPGLAWLPHVAASGALTVITGAGGADRHPATTL